MVKFCRSISFSLILVLFGAISFAQETAIYSNPARYYRSALDLFAKEKYGAAQDVFEKVMREVENPFSPLRVNAEYYNALCAVELYNRDAEYKLTEFARKYPASSYINLVNFQLGKLTYGNRKYRSALENFEKVDIAELSADERSEYYFKSGYCYFKQDDFEKARQAFEKVVNSDSKYSSPAYYYIAHLDYSEGKYEKALEEFENLKEDPNFKAVAPYYIAQIYFLQGKYDKVIQTAPPLLVNATEKRAAELDKVLGQSYYYLGKYDKALPYLNQYIQNSHQQLTPEDYYILGFTLYKKADFEEAAKNLQRATGNDDTIAHYAYYYLGACYLQSGQKQFAANAFNSAYKMTYDREIREDALFNQAQLAFELSYDPYSEAVKALRAYLKAYPDSKRADEAYNFLFRISMATRNYKDAQEALENIQVKGADYKGNFQRITYYRGIELFNQYNYEEAEKMFQKAVDYNIDKEITAESIFWTAESFYRQGNYWGAKKYYLDFLGSDKAKKLPVYNLANYNLGYVYFKREEYKGAIYCCEEFIDRLSDEQAVMVADAFLRLGDSWFISKGYDEAISYYDKAINMAAIDVDYAMLQKSKGLGVLQRYPEQITILKSLISGYPKSSYLAEAQFDLANVYLLTKDNENALIHFKKVAENYPGSNYAVKARLKSGLIYYNSNMNDLALITFKGVVEDFPATPESKEALASIRNIYVDMGKVEDYFAYASSLGFTNISTSEQDSITYTSAENMYMKGDYSGASGSLRKYINDFPEGAFKTKASYYLAESLIQKGDSVEALKYYEDVITQPQSEFYESSLLKAADLTFDQGDHQTSLDYFIRLGNTAHSKENLIEAWYGQMKNSYLVEQYSEAITAADHLLAEGKLEDKMKLEAMMIRANSLYHTDEFLLAKKQFRDIANFSQGAAGAEAKYRLAHIEYDLKDFDASEKDVFDLINKYAPYDYWVASGFILLADIYVQKGNTFQAKQTLQSIIDNYQGKDLKEVAKNKLDKIVESEAATEPGGEENDSTNNNGGF